MGSLSLVCVGLGWFGLIFVRPQTFSFGNPQPLSFVNPAALTRQLLRGLHLPPAGSAILRRMAFGESHKERFTPSSGVPGGAVISMWLHGVHAQLFTSASQGE